MKISERQVLNYATSFCEFRLGLAGKSHHDIRANRGVGNRAADSLNLLAIMPRTIPAAHPAEHRVAARLHGHVRMLRDSRRLGYQLDQRIAPIHRLDRGDAKVFKRSVVEDRLYQLFQIRRPWTPVLHNQGREIAPPAAQVDSGDHYFAISCSH